MMDIKSFQEHVRKLSQKLDTTTAEQRIMYLVSEIGEVVDEVIALGAIDVKSDPEKTAEIKKRLGWEIYDVIWNAVDLANLLDIDLEESFKEKIAINAKRKWSHSDYIEETDN